MTTMTKYDEVEEEDVVFGAVKLPVKESPEKLVLEGVPLRTLIALDVVDGDKTVLTILVTAESVRLDGFWRWMFEDRGDCDEDFDPDDLNIVRCNTADEEEGVVTEHAEQRFLKEVFLF